MEGSAGSLVGGRKSRTWAKKAQKLRNFSRERWEGRKWKECITDR